MKNNIKADLILLPTKVKAPNYTEGLIVRCTEIVSYPDPEGHGIDTYCVGDLIISNNPTEGVLHNFEPMHLYAVLAHDKDNKLSHIGSGDYFIGLLNQIEQCSTVRGKEIEVVGKGGYYDKRASIFNKILASSDPSLKLPLIHPEFIQEYINLNGRIDQVIIELNKVEVKEYNGRYDDTDVIVNGETVASPYLLEIEKINALAAKYEGVKVDKNNACIISSFLRSK